MTTPRKSPIPFGDRQPTTPWTSHALEILWLLAVFLVPLAFLSRDYLISELELAFVDLPKIALFRTLAALMAAFWLIEWALPPPTSSRRNATKWNIRAWGAGAVQAFHDLRAWVFAHPSRWVIAAAALFLFSTLLSTALSVSFSVSAWGLVPGLDSYPAYTVVAHLLLFGAVATHLKTRAQLARLLGAVVCMAVLVSGYAVAQRFGMDPFSLLEGTSRASSTLGNPIVAGSVLVLTIPLTLAAAVATLDHPVTRAAFWWRFLGWTPVLGVQFLGLIYTFSRGPWVGAIAALAALLSLILLFAGWRNWIKTLLVLGAAAGLCALVVSATQDVRFEEPASQGGLNPVIIQAISGEAVAQRFTSVGREVASGGLSSRIQIWRASQRLILQRPWFEFEDLSLAWLRPVTGYGPDFFKYTYLLERRPQPGSGNLVSERFAHNYFIHKAVELGGLGFISSLGLFLVPFGVGGYLLIRYRKTYSFTHRLVLAGILATLAGRFLEQMVGVASVSDLAITWALLGAFAALPAVMGESPALQEPGQEPGQPALRRREGRRLRASNTPLDSDRIWRLALVAALIGGIGTLTWIKTIEYPLAAVKAMEGAGQITRGELPNALASLEEAVSLAPDVFVYSGLQASVYDAYGAGAQTNREAGCGVTDDETAYQTCLARKALSHNRQAARQRPMDWRPQLAVAESTLALASLDRSSPLDGDTAILFQRVAQMDPQAWWRWETLAWVYNQTGQPQKALETLETSYALVGDSNKAAYLLLIQGVSWRNLGQTEEALDAFDRSIDLFGNLEDYRAQADAYSNRGAMLIDAGQYHKAISDLNQAVTLNPDLATAFNNRANAYANLDLFQKALDDYQEALRLDPRMALAYFNRALAYTYLGDDQNAQLDVERIMDLGLDTTTLSKRIENAKNNR